MTKRTRKARGVGRYITTELDQDFTIKDLRRLIKNTRGRLSRLMHQRAYREEAREALSAPPGALCHGLVATLDRRISKEKQLLRKQHDALERIRRGVSLGGSLKLRVKVE